MNSFGETVLDKWLTELQTTLEDNNENGANRDGVCIWEIDDVDKLYFDCATSDDDKQAYEYTIDGAKQLESENDLQHSVKGYKSVSDIHDGMVDDTIDKLTIWALNEWLTNSDEYIIDVNELENNEISWDLLVDLVSRQRVTEEDLLNYDYIYCGTYYKDTKALDNLQDFKTLEEWSNLFDTDDSLYDEIVEYAG